MPKLSPSTSTMTGPGGTALSLRPTAAITFTLCLLTIFARATPAQTEIHRCNQPDGTIAYQAQPCAHAESADVSETEADADPQPSANEAIDPFASPYDRPQEAAAAAEATGKSPASDAKPPASQARRRCEDDVRTRIDAIEVELRDASTPADDRERLGELLELTARLRDCKAL